jgi:hypothetical protein
MSKTQTQVMFAYEHRSGSGMVVIALNRPPRALEEFRRISDLIAQKEHVSDPVVTGFQELKQEWSYRFTYDAWKSEGNVARGCFMDLTLSDPISRETIADVETEILETIQGELTPVFWISVSVTGWSEYGA